MDAAFDVLPDLFGFVPAQTQCGHCGKVILLADATITYFMIMEIKVGEDHFCSEECAMSDAPFKSATD